MNQQTATHATAAAADEATGTKTTPRLNICASYHATRFDLPEGREWLVTTNDHPGERPHAYVVTVWVEEDLGRIASCRCDAFRFGNPCRHIRYAQAVDSILTNAPVREPQPVYS